MALAGTPPDPSPAPGTRGGTLLRSGQPRILCAWRATEPAYHTARTALFDAGYSVLEVWDLTMLQRVLQERNFDLLIFDIRLPDVSFPQVVQMTGRGGRSMPIVVVSDRSNAEWRWSTFDGGAYEYLVLPSEEQEFLHCVDDALATERFKTDFPVFAGAATPPPPAAQSPVHVAPATPPPSPPRHVPDPSAPVPREAASNVRPFPSSALPIPAAPPPPGFGGGEQNRLGDPAPPPLPVPPSPKEAGDLLAMRKDISAVKERERQLRIELEAKERMIKKMERFESMVIELQSENAHLKEAIDRAQENAPPPPPQEPHGESSRGNRLIPALLTVLLVLVAGGFYVWKNGLPGRPPVPDVAKPAAPAQPTARIFHPTELTDVALSLAETLGRIGVQVQALDPLTNAVSRTAVFYGQGKEEAAQSVAGHLGPDVDLRPRDWSSGADLIIVLGEDRLEEP